MSESDLSPNRKPLFRWSALREQRRNCKYRFSLKRFRFLDIGDLCILEIPSSIASLWRGSTATATRMDSPPTTKIPFLLTRNRIICNWIVRPVKCSMILYRRERFVSCISHGGIRLLELIERLWVAGVSMEEPPSSWPPPGCGASLVSSHLGHIRIPRLLHLQFLNKLINYTLIIGLLIKFLFVIKLNN